MAFDNYPLQKIALATLEQNKQSQKIADKLGKVRTLNPNILAS
jgi:RimJ/RimL family protein N-acetyltransferase